MQNIIFTPAADEKILSDEKTMTARCWRRKPPLIDSIQRAIQSVRAHWAAMCYLKKQRQLKRCPKSVELKPIDNQGDLFGHSDNVIYYRHHPNEDRVIRIPFDAGIAMSIHLLHRFPSR